MTTPKSQAVHKKLGEALALIHARCALGQCTRALYVVINAGDVNRQRGLRQTYRVSPYISTVSLTKTVFCETKRLVAQE